MSDKLIRKKLIEHLNGLNELEKHVGNERMVKTLSERYDVPEKVIKKTIAEWQAGQKQQ